VPSEGRPRGLHQPTSPCSSLGIDHLSAQAGSAHALTRGTLARPPSGGQRGLMHTKLTGPPTMNYERLYEYRFREISQGRRGHCWAAVAPMLYELLKRPERVLDPAAGRFEFINAVPSAERWAVDAVASMRVSRERVHG